MDSPAEFRELLLDIGQGIGEGSSPMRAGGALGEDAFALQDQVLRICSASRACAMAGSSLAGAACGFGFSSDFPSNP